MSRNGPLLSLKALPWLILAAIASAFGVALLAQYGFGLAPCELCHWQRYGYGMASLIALPAAIAPKPGHLRLWLALLALALFATALIAFYHVGVEYHWWQGTGACGAADIGGNIADITRAIENAPLTRCDEPAFTLFGLSMAFYNMLYALGLSVLAAWGALRHA